VSAVRSCSFASRASERFGLKMAIPTLQTKNHHWNHFRLEQSSIGTTSANSRSVDERVFIDKQEGLLPWEDSRRDPP